MHKSALLIACVMLSLGACEVRNDKSEKKESAETTGKPAWVARTGARLPPAAPARSTPAAVLPAPGDRLTGGPLAARQVPNPPFKSTEVARFNQPWAMTFLPDGRLLVTEKSGRLRLANVANGQVGEVVGVPAVAYGGQGGLGDVVLHPQFHSNRLVYLSYAEEGSGGRGAAVARAILELDASGNGGHLSNLQVLWRQVKVSGDAHYSHRIAFDRAGKLWISSGERQKGSPAQDMQSNLGKIIRLNADGSIPADNPFVAQGGIAAQVWSLGHRNVYGLAFDANGRLWEHEMGRPAATNST